MKKFLVLFILAFSINTSFNLFAQAPWDHGKLEVAKNSHFIQHADGTPFLWIGDTGWGMMQQLTREEVDLYLDSRQKLGFTVIQTVAHWSPHGGGMQRSPDNAANAYGFRPFTGTEEKPNTAEPIVVKGGTPDKPNDYWDHVDFCINAIKKRNMYLALLPCWASQLITGKGEYTVEEAKIYGTFLGNRYKNEPHIIWMLGGDTKAQFKGFDKNQKYAAYDFRPIYRAMAEGIVKGVTGQSPVWNQSSPAWDQVFMTYHPDGDADFNSSKWFHQDAWLDANGIEVWKEVNEVYRTVLDDYQMTEPVKPTLFLEGSYEYGTYRHECGWVTPVRVRRQLYQTFFAGGAGHTYGAGPIWAMRGDGGDYNCGYTWKEALNFPGAKQVAIIGKDFLSKHNWSQWIPNGNVIAEVGEGENLKVAVTTANGDMALVYFSDNSNTSVKNILKKEAEAYWFYPRDGEIKKVENFNVNESRNMVPPEKWEDAVLVLKTNN